MHVVVLADYGGPYAGSFVPMLRAVRLEARRRGHTMHTVFTPVARGRGWLSELADDGMPISFAGSTGSRDLVAAIEAALPAGSAPAVMHSHFTAFDVPALRIARGRAETAVIWHVHTRLEPSIRVRAANAVKFGVLGRRVDRIVCVAPHIAVAVRRRLGPRRRITTIPNAVETARFPLRTPERVAAVRERLGIPSEALVLLHFGRMWELKGGDLLLEAVRRLADRGTEVTVLTVSGDEPARADAARLRLDGVVRPIEPMDDVGDLYAAADAFVSCSRAEGMPYSLLEAAATGTGLLASDIAGQGQLARLLPGARVVALDADEIADGLQALLARDRSTVEADGAATREWVCEHADLAIAARSLVDLYERLV